MSSPTKTFLACLTGALAWGQTAAGQDRPAPAEPPGAVRQIKVVADKAPDCSTLKSMVDTVTRGCRTNDEKAIAIYNFMRMVNYHRQYPAEKGGIAALKLINVYGWSLCGGQHAALSALWRTAGWKWRFQGWPGHTTVEAFYDDKWHYFDTFLKVYVWRPDGDAPGGRTVAGQADIAANPALITEGLVLDQSRKVYYHAGNRFEIVGEQANWTAPALLVCGDEPAGVISGCKARSDAGSPSGWMGIKHAEDGYSTDVNLPPGCSLTLMWSAIEGAHWWNGRKDVPEHTCGDKDYRNCPALGPVLEPYAALHPRGARTFASGVLLCAPDVLDEAFLSGAFATDNAGLEGGRIVPADASRAGSVTIRLASPYVMSRAHGEARGADSAEISLDGGKTFKAVELKDFSDAVGGSYDCLVRLAFKKPLTSLRLHVIVQHNRCALPYLSPGRNRVTVSVADPKQLGSNRLVVTYLYSLGERSASYEQLAEMDAEVARAHKANWSDTPTAVEKTFRAQDLPAAFEIDVPTPKDKFPVYPRMLLLRRQVLGPSDKPLPLPAGAEPPKTGPGDVLKTLPNPFHVGIAPAPKKVARPTTIRRVALQSSHVVTMKGEVFGPDQFIKWLKDNSEAWVLLVGGELKDLPEPRRIASARVVLAVSRGHEQAATKVGVVLLNAPFEKGKPYDLKGLPGVAGSAVVPSTPEGKGFDPPREFRLDVTRMVKQLAAGQAKFHGLAVRTVPDRGVDDGWTVRVNLSTTVQPYIEIETYTDK